MPRPVTALKVAIVASGRTQREVAEAIGIDETRMSRIVNGEHADDTLREAIATTLGRTTDDLFPAPTAESEDLVA